MPKEASKTQALRSPAQIRRLFGGTVLDIGCGDDLVVGHAQPFDRAQGDCSHILDYLSPESFDCVHSCHCLEHMPDVPGVLADWWRLVKPGGFLVLIVPDEELYEQASWPSLFNTDHKATFRLGGPPGSPVSHDLEQLLAGLDGAKLISLERQDQGYDHRKRKPIKAWGRVLYRFGSWRSAVLNRYLGRSAAVRALDQALFGLERALGQPWDQTSHGALAQIEGIVQKGEGASDAADSSHRS